MTSEQLFNVKDESFLVLPEYYSTIDKIVKRAKKQSLNIISGYHNSKESGVVLVDNTGTLIARRKKVRLVKAEQDRGMKAGKKILLFRYKDITILPLICYEIVYPIDYYHFGKEITNFSEKIDFITHHIYSPMFDIYQYEGWRALQQAVGQHYNCPVIVACGEDKRVHELPIFNLTKTILPTETEEFTVDKFNRYRRFGL